NKDAIFSATRRACRAAQIAVVGWPTARFPAGNTRNWTLPWDRFPPSLREDCISWSHQVATSDPFEHPGRLIRPVTADNREWQIRCFASALILCGRDPNTITSLNDLVDIETFKQGLRYLIERKNGKPTTGTCNLARGLKAVAQHHVGVDRSHVDEMGTLIRKLL